VLLYVPQAELAAFEKKAVAGDHFKQVATELARENRELLVRRRKVSKKRRSDGRWRWIWTSHR
jgi:hypothetical protein